MEFTLKENVQMEYGFHYRECSKRISFKNKCWIRLSLIFFSPWKFFEFYLIVLYIQFISKADWVNSYLFYKYWSLLDDSSGVITFISHLSLCSFLCSIFQKMLKSKLSRKCFLVDSSLFLVFILSYTVEGLPQHILGKTNL